MKKTLLRPCPVCAHGTGRLAHTQRLCVPDELGAADAFDVVTCARCGFAFADVATTQVELDQTYEEHSKYADASLLADASYSDPPWDTARMDAVAAWLSERIGSRATRVLDAGCAGGSFLAALKARGFDALTGIDPSPRVAALVRARYGIDAVAASFFSLPPALGTFGLVTLQHTLEHLGDVRGAVRALRATLDDGGLAYVEVPDARRYTDFLAAPFQDFNTEHINHFSLAGLDRLMQANGFVAEAIGEKTIFASARHPYPAAFGLWRKSSHEPAATLAYDSDLVAGIGRYVEESNRLMRRIDTELRAALVRDEHVVLWGTGQLAFKLLTDTVLAQKSVTCIDGSPEKNGLHINGARILAPGDLPADDDRPIVIGSIHAADGIAAAIRSRFGPDRRIVRLSEGPAAAAAQAAATG
uniref:Methyltransferase domain n=1 Tax=uncultured organism TaxID=155900 RepID=A0A7L9QC34_9ZZZZ|nr:hypothetical protein [uncultured organism]